MKDYSELKKLAEAATQGEWRHDTKSGKIGAVEVDGYDIVQVQSRRRFDYASRNADAAFIAGANPYSVMCLIDDNEETRMDAARYRWLKSTHWFDVSLCAYGDICCGDGDFDEIDDVIDAAMGNKS